MPEPLDTFLRLRQQLQDVHENDGVLTAWLTCSPNDPVLAKCLADLVEAGVISEIHQEGSRVFLPDLRPGRIDLQIDTGNLPGYFDSYDILIERYPNQAPSHYSVWGEQSGSTSSYLSACQLLQFLESRVEVWDTTRRRFYFVDQQAVEVGLIYKLADTDGLTGHLPNVLKFLNPEHSDPDTKWALFRKAAIRLLRDVNADDRLGVFFRGIKNLVDRAEQDYSLYLERFSFEDLLKKFDEERLKFVSDLGNVLGTIQTALIAVPIEFFLIADKLEPTTSLTGKNLILASAGFLFFALLVVLLLNQGEALEGIRLALVDFEKEQVKRHTDKSSRLKEMLNALWKQYGKVHSFLLVVEMMLVLFMLVMVAALLWCSTPSWQSKWRYSQESVSPTPAPTPTATPMPAAPTMNASPIDHSLLSGSAKTSGT